MARSNLCDLELCLHFERPKALLVSTDGVRATAVWIPKEPVEWEVKKQTREGTIIIATMPQDLAEEKGLV